MVEWSTGRAASLSGTKTDWADWWRRASSGLGCSLDSAEEVGDRRMIAKLSIHAGETVPPPPGRPSSTLIKIEFSTMFFYYT